MRRIAVALTLAFLPTLLVAAAIAQPPAAPPPRLMEAIDTNHDGVLSADEIQRAPEAIRKLDKNGDGRVEADELRARGPAGPALYGQPDLRSGMARFDALPLAKDDSEKKILDVLADMAAHRIPGGANVPPGDGRILRLIAESIGAKHVVELGTSTGFSGVWFCLALRQTKGTLTTFEIDPGRAAEARRNFQRAGVSGLVTLVEGDAHQRLKELKKPVDLVFLDADKTGYLDYLEKLLPWVRPGGLIVAHNMNEHHADPRYVKAITTNPDLESVFLNLETSGIGVTLKKR